MTAPSREAQQLLDRLIEIARLIEQHEVALWALKHEQQQLRAELGATGHRAGEPDQRDLL